MDYSVFDEEPLVDLSGRTCCREIEPPGLDDMHGSPGEVVENIELHQLNPFDPIHRHTIAAASVIFFIDDGIRAGEVRITVPAAEGPNEIDPLAIVSGEIRSRQRPAVAAHDIH